MEKIKCKHNKGDIGIIDNWKICCACGKTWKIKGRNNNEKSM